MLQTPATELEQQALDSFNRGKYEEAITLYEQMVETNPEARQGYWYLGLALLLQGQEVEAQVTWMLVIGEGNEAEVEQWTQELVEILATEANRQEEKENFQLAWVVRQHIREINPTDVNNLLKLLQLGLKLEVLTEEELDQMGIISILETDPETLNIDFSLLLQTLKAFLDQAPLDPFLPQLAEASVNHVLRNEPLAFVDILLFSCVKICQTLQRPDIAVQLTEIALKTAPENVEILRHISSYYQTVPDYEKGIEAAEKALAFSTTPIDKIISYYIKVRALMGAGGYWQESLNVAHQQAELLQSLNLDEARNYEIETNIRLYTTAYFFPYFEDRAENNRQIHNSLAQFCQAGIEFHAQEKIQTYHQNWNPPTQADKRLKIGYLSHCFSTHSVGWLARWLFQHHDRENYDIYAYVVNYRSQVIDPLQQWFVNNVTEARKLGLKYNEVADQISEDRVDILVDLDSLTLDLSCAVLAMKPAPIQVSWLGWDAPGIPTVDYMIADPYVLPDNAQDYYSEKIWRLPQTYVAVDGFEVGVPSLRREMLDVPNDAILYFSSQRGYKRHPETARLQLKIIKEVPNSYFLIKGYGDQTAIQRFFLELAEEEGVSEDRLKFVLPAPSSAMHRANMGIADVVLDTYPYNGATTTLETLWMCVPLVTRVGQQFAARNSYTMLVNAGVSEGIAWTDEEYVEWGVRFGTEPELRQKVHWTLSESRKTSPLWNGKQFAQEMEKAYRQMWQRYVES
jgi:predicted O-linked N-acetylglucosamine transferase (SPINDLY family)